MKMTPASTISLFYLFCSIVPPTGSQRECDGYAAVGGDFVVPLNSKQKDPIILQWQHNATPIFSRKGGHVVLGKSDDVDQSGSLRLKNVTASQAGSYTPLAHDADRKAEKGLKTTRLCVIAAMSKPAVTVKCEGSEKVTFTCTVHPKDLPPKKAPTVVWLREGKLFGKKNEWSLRFVAKSVAKDKFSCNVSNEVSHAASEPKTQTCYKSLLPDEVLGISIWAFIGGGGGIVLLLTAAVVVCCLRTRRMRRARRKDEDELRLQWTDTGHHQGRQPADRRRLKHAGCHHHQHQCSRQQPQPAGHTGPRPGGSRQRRDQQQAPPSKPPNYGQPLPTPRGAAPEGRRPAADEDAEQPPPLPQPRKKTPRTQRE